MGILTSDADEAPFRHLLAIWRERLYEVVRCSYNSAGAIGRPISINPMLQRICDNWTNYLEGLRGHKKQIVLPRHPVDIETPRDVVRPPTYLSAFCRLRFFNPVGGNEQSNVAVIQRRFERFKEIASTCPCAF